MASLIVPLPFMAIDFMVFIAIAFMARTKRIIRRIAFELRLARTFCACLRAGLRVRLRTPESFGERAIRAPPFPVFTGVLLSATKNEKQLLFVRARC